MFKAQTKALVEVILKTDNLITAEERTAVRAVIKGEPFKIQPKSLNLTQSAKWVGISRQSFHKLVKLGVIRPVVIGTLKMYLIDDLKKMLGRKQ